MPSWIKLRVPAFGQPANTVLRVDSPGQAAQLLNGGFADTATDPGGAPPTVPTPNPGGDYTTDAELAAALAGIGAGAAAPTTDAARESYVPARLSDASLKAAYAVRLPVLEGVDLYGYGHSYLTNGSAQKFLDRVAKRVGMNSYVNRGVGGTSSDQMANKVLNTWVPGTPGVVAFCIALNDYDLVYGADPKGPAFTVSNIRTAMACVSAVTKVEDTSTAFAYPPGAGWSASTSDVLASGGTSHSTSTVGNYVDIGFTGNSVQVVVRAQSGACTISAAPSTGGSPAQSFDVSGRYRSTPHVITLTGYGNGDHVARLTLTAGGPLVVDCALTPSSTPPGLLFIEEGSLAGQYAAQTAYLASTVLPAVEAMIAAEFPRCIVARFTPGWDSATMTDSGGVHLVDAGNAHVADNIVTALAALDYTPGQNLTTTPAAIPPSPVVVTPPASHTATVKQQTGNAAAASTVTATLPSTPAVGNLLVATWSSGATPTAGTPTLPSGWTVSSAAFSADGDATYIAHKVATSADQAGSTYTFGYSTAGSGTAVRVVELAGVTPTVNATGRNEPTTDMATKLTGSLTTTLANCVVVGALQVFGAGGAFADTWSAAAGTTAATWTDLGNAGALTAVQTGVAAGMAVAAAAGTYGGQLTINTTRSTYVGAVAAFVLA